MSSELFAVVASALSPAYVKVKSKGEESTVSLIGGAQFLKWVFSNMKYINLYLLVVTFV